VDFLLPTNNNIKVHVASGLVHIEDLSLNKTVAIVIEANDSPNEAG